MMRLQFVRQIKWQAEREIYLAAIETLVPDHRSGTRHNHRLVI